MQSTNQFCFEIKRAVRFPKQKRKQKRKKKKKGTLLDVKMKYTAEKNALAISGTLKWLIMQSSTNL